MSAQIANRPMSPGCGLLAPNCQIDTKSKACTKNNQLRRCPNNLVKTGRCSLSTKGAQRNFIVYGMPNATAKPMVAVSMPTLASQNVIVATSKVSGKPLEIPSRKVMTGFLRKYGRNAGTVSAINGRASKMPPKMIKRSKSTDIWPPPTLLRR